MKRGKFNLYYIALLLLTSCNNGSNDYVDPVIVNNEIINSNVTYNGEKVSNKFVGTGTLTYINNYELTGTFKNDELDTTKKVFVKYLKNNDQFTGYVSLSSTYDLNLVEGVYTRKSDHAIYTGKFKNNKFDDKNGKLEIANLGTYIGEFENGSNIDKIGTIYFKSYYTNAIGMHYFNGKMQTENSFYDNQEGKGSIKYEDNSIYTGNMVFINGGYYRKGFGEMDFSTCHFLGISSGAGYDTRLYKYVGEFDYLKSGWMYGNGIMYYVDANTYKPKFYQKGKWYGLSMIGAYNGDIELLKEFENTIEEPYLFNYPYMMNYVDRYYYNKSKRNAVICGDSYTDMMHENFNIVNFEKEFPAVYNTIDTGIGATTYYQWINYAKYLIIPYNPDKVFLHLGFNDLHMGLMPEEVIQYASKLVSLLKNELPNTTIYLMTVEPSPTFSNFLNIEIEYNKLLKEYCNNNNIKLLDNAKNFYKNETQTIDNLSSYFISDMVHMNKQGYEKFIKLIKDEL